MFVESERLNRFLYQPVFRILLFYVTRYSRVTLIRLEFRNNSDYTNRHLCFPLTQTPGHLREHRVPRVPLRSFTEVTSEVLTGPRYGDDESQTLSFCFDLETESYRSPSIRTVVRGSRLALRVVGTKPRHTPSL